MANTPALMSYFGGKNKFKKFISPVVPSEYKIYLEPFSGSFGVYFFLDMPKNTQVRFNDINKDQTNLVACSKDYKNFYKFLKNEIENPNGSLYCKETDESLKKQYYKELYYSYKKSDFRNETYNIPDMKRASQYAFLLTSAFSSCSYTAAGFSGFKLMTFLRKLKNVELQKKLSKITSFETLDFEEVIKKYDSEDTFIYLDPPYYEEKNKRSGWYGTKDEFGQDEHMKLLELLKKIKSKWALSYYYYSSLEKMLPKDEYIWLEKKFFRSSASFSDTKNIKGKELLILNYTPENKPIIEEKKTFTKKIVKPMAKKFKDKSEKELIDEIEEKNEGAFIVNSSSKKLQDGTKENYTFISEEDKNKIVNNLNYFIKNQKDIDPEIAKIVNDNFWELIGNLNDVISGSKELKNDTEEEKNEIEDNNEDDNKDKNKGDIDDFWYS